MKLQDSQLSAYLLDDPYLKINGKDIIALCHRLFDETDKETDIIRKAFKFVLDQIDHSWDIKQTEVSISASDVLENGHDRWIRLDARGNKPGIDAACSFTTEKLAFYPDRALGERDYAMIYVRPNPLTMAALEASSNILTLYVTNLPDNL